MKMEYFKIVNWEKYQVAAKKKGQVFSWIRLDTALLTDQKTYAMSALHFAIWVKLLLLGRMFDNKVALDLRYIAHIMHFRARNWRKNIAYFESLGLIEVFSAPRQTDKTDRQTESEMEERGPGPFGGPSARGKIPEETLKFMRRIGLEKNEKK